MPDLPRIASTGRRALAFVVIVSALLAYMSFLRRSDAESSDLSLSRFTELAFIAVAFLGAILLGHGRRISIRSVPATVTRAVTIAFTLWAMVTSLAGPLVLTGLVKSLELLMIIVIVHELAALDLGICRNAGGVVSLLLAGIMAVLILLILANLAQQGVALPMEHVQDWSNEAGRPRLILGTNHPLSSALFLAFGVVTALCAEGSWIWRAPAALALLWLLHLCDARGIEAGCILGILIWGIRQIPRSPFKTIGLGAVVGGILLGVVGIILDSDLAALILNAVGNDAWTLDGRVPLWSYVLGQVPKHPLIGVGFFSTRQYILDAFPFAGHAHNSAIEVLFGTGLVGAALFACFLILLVYALALTRNLLLAAMTPILLIEGSLDPILFTPGVGMFATLLVLETALLRHAVGMARNACHVHVARRKPACGTGRGLVWAQARHVPDQGPN